MIHRNSWTLVLSAAGLLVAGAASPGFAAQTGTAGQQVPGGFPATDILFQAADAAHPVCPPFGACPPALQITTEYIGFGVDFTQFDGNPPVGVFTDPPDEFGGVNAQEILDLLTDVNGRIVETNTTTQGLTDIICMSAGFVAGPADLLLEAFDAGGNLVGSSIADDGTDPDGRLIAVVDAGAGNNVIASFRVSTPTGDTYGVLRICLNDPGPIPVELQSFDVE
jgi:hypothetical protein